MRTGAISNAQIKASSEWDSNHAAIQGRLNFKAIPAKPGSWTAGRNDLNQWLEVFLGRQLTDVTGVATQGRHDINFWVIRYKLMLSVTGGTFQDYKQSGQVSVKVRYKRRNKRDFQVCLLDTFKLSFSFSRAYSNQVFSFFAPFP